MAKMISESKNTTKINYKKIYTIANEYLATSSAINSFPFIVKGFVYEQSDIKLCSFKKAMDKYGVQISMFGSESAIIQEMNGAYIIFYNSSEPDTRVRFSIMHEYGHFVLHHKMNLSQDNPLYHVQESEANCFAAQMLMPEQLLRECSKRHKTISINFIMNSFSVSEQAAQRRQHTLACTDYEWRSRAEKEYDDIILMKYADILNSIAPKPREFQYYDFETEYEKQCERDSWYSRY